jgi:hypothetical protein
MGQSVTFISPQVPAHIVELLGTAPLLKGEDPKRTKPCSPNSRAQ